MEIIIKTHGIAEAAKAVNGIEGELLCAVMSFGICAIQILPLPFEICSSHP